MSSFRVAVLPAEDRRRRSGRQDLAAVLATCHRVAASKSDELALERDLHVRYETVTTLEAMLAFDAGRVPAAGDSGCLPEQPAGALRCSEPWPHLAVASPHDAASDRRRGITPGCHTEPLIFAGAPVAGV